ncbi:MAG: AbrB/MazE/SpoVT family DNA-binding domain-containing protein [Candidatus Daviesbacteria bacterium]|nr:AbrB/MazE/SpoVT family DNA-binding domain-containing protein [Candidatus Daviesbacteria bacterium]
MRKVFKNGNSLAVTVPKTYAHQLSIRDGSQIEWKKTSQGLVLIHQKKAKIAGVDQKFAKMVDKFANEHQDVLQELSQR